jgi:hypothetical protein
LPEGWEAALRQVPVGNSAVRKTVVEQCIEAIQALGGDVSATASSEAQALLDRAYQFASDEQWVRDYTAFCKGAPTNSIELLKELRAAIEPLTKAQIRLHRIAPDLATRLDAVLGAKDGREAGK